MKPSGIDRLPMVTWQFGRIILGWMCSKFISCIKKDIWGSICQTDSEATRVVCIETALGGYVYTHKQHNIVMKIIMITSWLRWIILHIILAWENFSHSWFKATPFDIHPIIHIWCVFIRTVIFTAIASIMISTLRCIGWFFIVNVLQGSFAWKVLST